MLYFKAHGSNLVGLGLCERVLRTAPPDRTKARALALMSRGINGVMLQKTDLMRRCWKLEHR